MNQLLDRAEVDASFGGIRGAYDFHPESVGEGQVLNLVGYVVGARREYYVTRREAHR